MYNFVKRLILEKIYSGVYKLKIDKYVDLTKQFWIPPQLISRSIISGWYLRYSAPRNNPERVRILGAVISGTWDLFSFKINKSNKYRDFQFRYRYCWPWNKTQQPKQLDIVIKGNGVVRGNSNTFIDYEHNVLYQWDQLYAEIRSCGYKSAIELGLPVTSNIEVAIGRSGRIYLVDGKHRLIMSQLLNLDYIPVAVNVIHKNYYSKLQKESGSSSLISKLDAKFHNKRR